MNAKFDGFTLSLPSGKPWLKRIYKNARLLLVLTLLVAFSSACSVFSPKPTPTITPVPAATFTPAPTSNGLVADTGQTLAPQLIQRQPAGGQELPLNGDILLTFDQAMNPDTTDAAWQVQGPDGKAVEGEISWPTPRTLKFTPGGTLASGKTYLASLSTQATSAEGVPLADPLSLQFDTIGDLQVSQVFPADGTSDVAGDAVITVIFNRPVVPLVIQEEQANLPSPVEITPAVSGKGEWVNTSVYAFHADTPLKGAATYSLAVKAGLADASGDTRLAQDYTWQFTTATPSIANLQLRDGTTNPNDNFQNLLLDDYFRISFHQPMDPASTEANLSLTSTRGEPVSLLTTWNEDDTQIVITPTQKLALGTSYTLLLNSEAQAAGGGALKDGLDWNFTTLPAPSVDYTEPANGSFQPNYSGELKIKFVSPMNFDSVKDKILVQPAPEGDIQWWYNDWEWSVSAYFLEPSTRYQVTLMPGMSDIYGNAIATQRKFSFTTAPYQPQANLEMPYAPAILRIGGPQEFYASYVNVNSIDLQLYQISPADFASFQSGKTNQWDYNPPSQNLIWQTRQTNDQVLNQRNLKSFSPTTRSGDPLPPGFYFLGLNSASVAHPNRFLDTRILIVASANLTFKSTTSEALMWLTDLTSGQPIAGAQLTVYDRGFQPIGQGVTDGDGMVYLNNLPTPENPYDPRYALSSDGQAYAFASSDWGSGVNTYDYGIWSSYYSPGNQPTAYVYTDRPIYRPGQPVYFKGILRLDDDLNYTIPKESQVKVTIDSFQDTVYSEYLSLSAFGSFDGQLTLDSNAALGYYTLHVLIPGSQGGDQEVGSVSFNVAEYRRPEFRLDVTSDKTDVLAGDTFNVSVAADYYSGGGVANAGVKWTLTALPYTFSPGGDLSRYSFSDFESDADTTGTSQPVYSQEIAQGQGQTGADGRFSLDLPADLSEFKTGRQLLFEATVSDLAGNQVSGRVQVTAHLSQVYVGVRPQTYVGITGQQQSFEMVAVDWDGNPLPDQKVSVDFVERRWYSVQEQDAQGHVQWSSTVKDIPISDFSDLVTDSQGLVTASFTPPNGGIFRAIATTQDSRGNMARSSAYLWVSGKEFIPWRQTNDRGFKLVVDRDSYVPGDTAEILIASPFQGDAYALVTVERGHVRFHEVVLLTSNSTVYKLPISADYAPNVFVSVTIVKGVDETNPRPSFKIGMAEIKVDTREQALDVQISADPAQAGPGEKVTYTVTAQDYQGNPVSTELSLGLSDLATLSLTDPNSRPILDYFYSYRTLSVWTSVPIVQDIEDYNATIRENLAQGQGMGSGGGKGGGDFGVIEVRQNFPDTALWEAHVLTDQNGQASVTVTLPDNLTTWRMDARAVTQDTRVGQAQLDVISTKPLLVRPQTPRFFVVGDQALLGTGVQNNTGQTLAVNVALQAEGLTLNSGATQQVEIPAGGQAYVTWDVTVDMDAQQVDLVFVAEGGGYTDASRPTAATLEGGGIPVYRYEAPETVGTSGQMTSAGSRVEAISLPSTFDVSQGELTIQIAPSLAAGMTDGLTYLESYPYECVEQTISRFLPNVLTTQALQAAGLSDPNLEADLQTQVSTALQRLYNWQNPDGGWGWWNNQKSDVQTSAYVVLGLAESQAAGYTVSQAVLDRGANYLLAQLRSMANSKDPYVLNREAFVLFVLARTGSPQVSSAVQLYDQRQNLALYARAFLADTLYQIDSGDPRLQTLLSDFNNAAITSATGTHWEEASADIWNWNTDTRTTAILLATLSHIDPQNPLNANAARWLMSSRTDGHWLGTQETAWTLMALTRWMVDSGELSANYNYAVEFNGQRLGEGVANAETLRQTSVLQVNLADILKDQINRLAFARDGGPGNLYYTAHLNVFLPVEQVQALDQGIIVSRSYYADKDSTTPVTQANRDDLLYARLTVVVPHDLHYVVIDDPLPAGLEAVDQSLNTSPQAEIPQQYSWNDLVSRGWGWWFFNRIQIYDQKVTLSADYLPAGTYVYSYLVRAGTVGSFRVIPPTAQEFYFPEVYGRGEGSLFEVKP